MSVKPKIPEEARRYIVFEGIEWGARLLAEHQAARFRDLPEPVIAGLVKSYHESPYARLLYPDPDVEVQIPSECNAGMVRSDIVSSEQHASQIVVQ